MEGGRERKREGGGREGGWEGRKEGGRESEREREKKRPAVKSCHLADGGELRKVCEMLLTHEHLGIREALRANNVEYACVGIRSLSSIIGLFYRALLAGIPACQQRGDPGHGAPPDDKKKLD